MPKPKEVVYDKMSDEELDSALSDSSISEDSSGSGETTQASKNIEDLSDEELDQALIEPESTKTEQKLSFSEKVADVFLQGGITEGKKTIEHAASGEMGAESEALAKGIKSVQSSAKTIGNIGQSILAGNATAKALSGVPFLAKQPIIQGLVASAETKAANAGIRLSNIQRAAQRYAIEGAVAAQPFDYESVGDRIKATAIATAIAPMAGLSIEAVSGALIKSGRSINKFKSSLKEGVKETVSGELRDPRMPAIARIKDALSTAEREGTEIGQSSKRQILESQRIGKSTESAISERAGKFRDIISEETKKVISSEQKSLKSSVDQINSSIKKTDDLLRTESDIAAKSYQNKVTSFFRSNSNVYGQELDSVSDTIAKTGRMTRKEAYSVLRESLKKSETEAEIVSGEIVDSMRDLINKKYGPSTVNQMDDLIDFKEFLKDARDIWKKPFQGSDRLVAEEIPAAILKSEFGELVSRLPGGEDFKSLQSAYRPVISYMNKANAVLQPYKGEAYTKTAELLVKNYAKGTASEADKHLIDFLENGTERFAKGMGAISGRAKQLGSNMKTLSSEMKKMKLSSESKIIDIAQEGADKISKIDLAEKNALKLIQEETERRSFAILQEAAEEEARTWARAKQLKGRQMEVNNLTSRMKKIKNVSAGAIKLLAGLTSGYLVLRGGSEIVNTITKEQ